MFLLYPMLHIWSNLVSYKTGCGVNFLIDIVNNVMFLSIVLDITTVSRHSPKIIVHGMRLITVMV